MPRRNKKQLVGRIVDFLKRNKQKNGKKYYATIEMGLDMCSKGFGALAVKFSKWWQEK